MQESGSTISRVYNYYRTYDPSTGRYLESDPIGLIAGPNTHAYVGNMPTTYVDPFGLTAEEGLTPLSRTLSKRPIMAVEERRANSRAKYQRANDQHLNERQIEGSLSIRKKELVENLRRTYPAMVHPHVPPPLADGEHGQKVPHY